MGEVKPCPHCAGDANIETTRHQHPPSHWAKCSECGAASAAYASKASAIAAWNTRADSDVIGKLVEVLAWSTELDLEVLSLGSHKIGRVAASGGANNRPRWICNLDGVGSMALWRTEKTVEQARAALLLAVNRWFSAALPLAGGAETPTNPKEDGASA